MGKTVSVSDIVESGKIGGFQLRVLGLCAMLVFCDGFDQNGISYAAPAILTALHIGRPLLGPVFSAGVFGLMLGALTFGWLGDIFGRKRMFLFTGLMIGICSLATVTASTVGQLVLWRFLTGLALGGGAPLAVTLVSEYFPRRLRASIVMTMFCAVTLGGPIAGFINAYFNFAGWRTVFYAGAITPLVILPMLMLWLPESAEFMVLKAADPRRLRQILARVNPRLRLDDDTSIVLDEPKRQGVLVYHLFRDGLALRTILLWAMMAAALVGNYFFINWLPTLLHGSGFSAGEIVQITVAFQFGTVVGTLAIAWLALMFNPFIVIAVSYFCSVLLYLVLSKVGASYGALLVLNFFLGASILGTQSASNSASALLYPTGIRATGVGWGLGVGRIGGTLGPSIAGLLLALQWPTARLFSIAAISPLIASGAALAIGLVMRKELGHVAHAPTAAADTQLDPGATTGAAASIVAARID